MTKPGTAERIVKLDPSLIDVPPHHRQIDQDWAEALAADIDEREQEQPIKVVQCDSGRFELVFGAHRRAACLLAGKTVNAVVRSRDEAAAESDHRMSTIAENFFRRPNTVLERARDIGTWRDIHEAANGKPKRGRKKAAPDLDENSAKFALNFTEAAQRALDMSRRSVFLALKIASIPDAIADAIAGHAIANKQSDLLALADLDTKQQQSVADLIVSKEVETVEDALARIENRPLPPKVEPWERISNGVAALSSKDKDRLFEYLKPAFELWLAERS